MARAHPPLPPEGLSVETLLPFLIVCPLVFAASVVDAIAGGGGLISLPAYLIAGLPAHVALGTNKLSSCMGTALATLRYARHGFVRPRRALVCAAFGLAGSALGANLALLVGDGVLQAIMLVVVPLTAAYVLRRRAFEERPDRLSPRATLALCAAVSCALGVYDGFFGPGTGTYLILLFVAVCRLPLAEAAGTTKVVNLTTNVAALAVFLANGTVLVPLGLAAGLFGMAGAWVGTTFFMGKGVKVIRPVMLVVLAVFFVRLAGNLLGAW